MLGTPKRDSEGALAKEVKKTGTSKKPVKECGRSPEQVVTVSKQKHHDKQTLKKPAEPPLNPARNNENMRGLQDGVESEKGPTNTDNKKN